jgi:hypothetical protein
VKVECSGGRSPEMVVNGMVPNSLVVAWSTTGGLGAG